ncbi:MAG: HK97 gp10 family phage protein [Actinomycetota bacterium]
MARNIPSEIEQALDRIASVTLAKMQNEAPKATGELMQSIRIKPSTGRREIGPGSKHGYYQEVGSTGQGKAPPKINLERWAMARGLETSNSALFLLGRKIKESGYKAQKFVEQTFDWVQPTMSKYVGDLGDRIVMWYERSGTRG